MQTLIADNATKVFLVRRVDDMVPVTVALDIFNEIGLSSPSLIVGFSYWVQTADALAGAFFCTLEWLDPTGQTRTIDGSVLSLADGVSFFASPVQFVQRQATDSALRFTITLNGVAGSALVGYRVFIGPSDDEQIQYW